MLGYLYNIFIYQWLGTDIHGGSVQITCFGYLRSGCKSWPFLISFFFAFGGIATTRVIFDIIREQGFDNIYQCGTYTENPETANMNQGSLRYDRVERNRSFHNMTFGCHNIIIVTVSISPTGLRYWINQRLKRRKSLLSNSCPFPKTSLTCLISHTDLDESQFWKDACHAWRQARNETNFKLRN